MTARRLLQGTAITLALLVVWLLAGRWSRPKPVRLPHPIAPAVVEAEDLKFRVVPLAAQLESPWSMAFLPTGEILVTERPGRLRLIGKDGTLQAMPLAGVPEVFARAEGGLFDVRLHPRFSENRLVYLSYAKPGPEATNTTAVSRGKLGPEGLQEVEEIFVADAWSDSNKHHGGRMVFDRDGFLYLTVGERQDAKRAQDPSDDAGTVLRLHDDGRVPKDNPFVGREGFRPEIYTYGHRNPQGLCLHPGTGEIWESEHGPRGGDEVNRIKAGANYGWPKVTFGTNNDGTIISDKTEMEGIESPVLQWTPAIAPSGLLIYDGAAFPAWKGNLFSGALALRHLRRVVLENGKAVHQEELLKNLKARIRDVAQGPDGMLYLLTDSKRGQILRLEPPT